MKTNFTLVLFSIAVCIANTNIAHAQINAGDSLALVDLYNSTDGQHWKNNTGWLTQEPVKNWFGIETKNNRVKYIFLVDNNLKGNLPASLGNLTALYQLYMPANKISGNLPSSLGNLVNVVDFDLSINQLSGNIPSSLGNLSKVNFLIFYNNQLTGSIPASLGNLKNLHDLDLNVNHLSGEIPSFKNAVSLGNLLLDHNKLSGNIPSSFKKLFFFNTLTVDHNQYTFDGLEKVAAQLKNMITYSHQKFIFIHKKNNMLSVNAGGTLSNNTYKWYKNGVLDTTITGDSAYRSKGRGIYSVNITNAIATEVSLHAYSIVFSSASGFNEAQKDDIINNKNAAVSVFPNPAKTNATIAFNATGKYVVKLTDASGKILLSKTGASFNNERTIMQIDVSSYAPGIYFITITGEARNKQVAKLNKQ